MDIKTNETHMHRTKHKCIKVRWVLDGRWWETGDLKNWSDQILLQDTENCKRFLQFFYLFFYAVSLSISLDILELSM